MGALKKFLASIGRIFKYHKLKIVSLIFFTLMFLLLLFPYGDLSGFVTAQVVKRSNGTAYIEFEDLGVGLLPNLGLKLKDVTVSLHNSPLPDLSVDALFFAPNWTGLLRFSPGASIYAEGLWQGELSLAVAAGDPMEDDKGQWQNLDINYSDFDIKDLFAALNLPVRLTGQGDLGASGKVDFAFKEQPELDVDGHLKAIVLPAQTLQLQSAMGPMPFPLPELKLKEVTLKGKLSEGDLIIDDAKIGNSQDKLNARIQGRMGLVVRGGAGRVQPVPGAYDFNIELNVHQDLAKDLSVLLFLDKFKKPTATGAKYSLRVSGTRMGGKASMAPFGGF